MGEDHAEQTEADMAHDRAATDRPTEHVRRRLTVSEAAEELGISAEAVRSRVKRGTLRSTKEGGSVYVLLPDAQTRLGDNQTTPGRDQTNARTTPEHDKTRSRLDDQAELIESLREQVAYMREQLAEEREARRRADTIMAQLSQANAEQARTIRALEAPQETPQGTETAAEEPEMGEPPVDPGGSQEATERRSWWRRFFGIE